MARTALTPVAVGAAGVVLPDAGTAAQLTDGNSYLWAQGRRLYVHNGDSTDLTVTVQTPATSAMGLAIADATYTVAAGKARLLPAAGLETRRTSDGAVWVDYTGADTGVTVAVLDL
ncbi:hypothetical protein AB0H03_06780 [Streptomyces sparsogenes]|uniref:hypothetical protein n=1 Tax=Streptomyces sparsogenes TaxID=67365 RepID=UPI0033E6004F